MRLSDKRAIVTGANRNIGQAIAIALAAEGAEVVISYRSDKAGAESTVDAIKKVAGKAKALYADFSETEGVERFFIEAIEILGSVDILVNNAGGYNTEAFLDLDVATFSHVHDISVRAPMLLTQLAAKHMIDQGTKGSVINISSITGTRPYPGRVAHATAKAALNMMTACCALELAKHDIRVNGIAPGSVPYEPTEDVAGIIPLGRMGRPEDIAQMAVFLASEDASWITGQVMNVDGGQCASALKNLSKT